MTTIQLDHSQYRSYDEDGDILATRSVRVKTISPMSESGPGIAAVLRTGVEFETGDGIGVELTITNDQLSELGYVKRSNSLLDRIFGAEPIDEPVLTLDDMEPLEACGCCSDEEPDDKGFAESGVDEATYLKAVKIAGVNLGLSSLAPTHQNGSCALPTCDYASAIQEAIAEVTVGEVMAKVPAPESVTMLTRLGVDFDTYQAAIRRLGEGFEGHMDPVTVHGGDYECMHLEKIAAAIPEGLCPIKGQAASKCLTKAGEFLHE